MEITTDLAVVSRARSGDAEAFRELVERHPHEPTATAECDPHPLRHPAQLPRQRGVIPVSFTHLTLPTNYSV